MPRPRFSEVLVSRRHELGLSVAQASRTLKLREDVLIAFEEGDFERMPQSGYAQGMLSSYARYLGLNARELVDLFQEELYQHQHGTSSHELRRRTRQTQSGRGVSGYEVPNEVSSRPKAYVEYRPLLPTGGGPAGDMGDFATTAMARPRNSVPLAGVGTPTPGARGSYGRSSYDDGQDGRRNNASDPRERQMPSTARRRAAGQRRRSGAARESADTTGRLIDEHQRSYTARGRTMGAPDRLYRRDDVSTRRVRPHEYTDDMRYDDEANPYAPASTISGRRSSRNIANVERPNVRRRAARPRAQGSGGRGSRQGGIVGQFLSDPRRTLFLIVILLAIVLTAILTFSVSSCVNARNQPTTGQVVPVGTADQNDQAQDDGTSADSQAPEEDSSEPSGDADAQDSADAETDGEKNGEAADEKPKETVVEVSVASGEVSWIEITCDGKSVIADSVTGPWSESYTVHDSITIQVAEPDVVTVKENGEEVDFTSHAGGLGSVTIEGTPAQDEDSEGADGTDGETSDEEASDQSAE